MHAEHMGGISTEGPHRADSRRWPAVAQEALTLNGERRYLLCMLWWWSHAHVTLSEGVSISVGLAQRTLSSLLRSRSAVHHLTACCTSFSPLNHQCVACAQLHLRDGAHMASSPDRKTAKSDSLGAALSCCRQADTPHHAVFRSASYAAVRRFV